MHNLRVYIPYFESDLQELPLFLGRDGRDVPGSSSTLVSTTLVTVSVYLSSTDHHGLVALSPHHTTTTTTTTTTTSTTTTPRLTASFPAQPGYAGTRKVKPVWI